MLRFISYLLISFSLLFSLNVQATIISSDDYLHYDSDGDGVADIDIVWASSIAFQFFGCSAPIPSPENYLSKVYGLEAGEDVKCVNQLLAPEYANDGWMFIEQIDGVDIDLVSTLFKQGLFADNQGGFKNGFEYWNTDAGAIASVNPFGMRFISDWTILGQAGSDPFLQDPRFYSNVFYARESQPVPEPSTLMVFALGLLGLTLRKRIK